MIFTLYYMYATFLQWWRLGALRNKLNGTLNSKNAILLSRSRLIHATKRQRGIETLLFHAGDRIACTIVPKVRKGLIQLKNASWGPFNGFHWFLRFVIMKNILGKNKFDNNKDSHFILTTDSWGQSNHFFPLLFFQIRPSWKYTVCWYYMKNFYFQIYIANDFIKCDDFRNIACHRRELSFSNNFQFFSYDYNNL